MPTIDFTTFNEESLRDWKPVLAKSLSPDWWKKMKVFQHDRGQRIQTIRACPAMDDWLKSGWYILANRDMEVVFDNGKTYTKECDEEVTQSQASPSHHVAQFAHSFSYLGEEGPVKDAFKMRNAWNIITPKGYSCFYLDPFLFQNNHFATWQGVIDTDDFNVNQDNSQIIFYPKVSHSFVIPKGTPLVQVIPFKREEWVSTYQLKDSNTWHKDRTEERIQELPGMDQVNREKYDKLLKEKPNNMGAYRSEGHWKQKGKNFKEIEPPPECPFHKGEVDGD